jgi:hypothetical protein
MKVIDEWYSGSAQTDKRNPHYHSHSHRQYINCEDNEKLIEELNKQEKLLKAIRRKEKEQERQQDEVRRRKQKTTAKEEHKRAERAQSADLFLESEDDVYSDIYSETERQEHGAKKKIHSKDDDRKIREHNSDKIKQRSHRDCTDEQDRRNETEDEREASKCSESKSMNKKQTHDRHDRHSSERRHGQRSDRSCSNNRSEPETVYVKHYYSDSDSDSDNDCDGNWKREATGASRKHNLVLECT